MLQLLRFSYSFKYLIIFSISISLIHCSEPNGGSSGSSGPLAEDTNGEEPDDTQSETEATGPVPTGEFEKITIENVAFEVDEDNVLNARLPKPELPSSAVFYSIVTSPQNGVVTITSDANGAFSYTPNTHFNGTDTFTFKIGNTLESTKEATATITVNSIEDGPISQDMSLTFDEDFTETISLTIEEPEGDLLTECTISNLNGVNISSPCTCDNNGCRVGISGNANNNGNASFRFQAASGESESQRAGIANISITPVNDIPVFNSVADQEGFEAIPLQFTISAQDVDGDNITYGCENCPETIELDTATGTVSMSSPTVSDNTYQFTASDGQLTAIEDIRITIQSRDPVAIELVGPINIGTTACSPYSVKLLDNDNRETNAKSATTVNITSTLSAATYSDASCTTSASSVALTTGESSKTIYLKNDSDEAFNLAAEDAATNLTGDNITGLVSLAPNKLVAFGPKTLPIEFCNPIDIAIAASDNKILTSIGTLTLNLTHGSSAKLYSDNDCSTEITSTSIAEGISSATIFIQNTTEESTTLTIADQGSSITNATLTIVFANAFENKTTEAGLDTLAAVEYGAAITDFDKDGYPDFYLSGNGLFRNQQNGTFATVNLVGENSERAAHWGDLDNNGYPDLIHSFPFTIQMNNGDGSFTSQNLNNNGIGDVGNLGDFGLIDINSDGFLDIWGPDGNGDYSFYINDQDETYTRINGEDYGITQTGNGEVNGLIDIDQDGNIDILYRLANEFYFFLNKTEGTTISFEEISSSSGISIAGGLSGFGFADVNQDGKVDIYANQQSANKLYINLGNNKFVDQAGKYGVAGGNNDNSEGVVFADLDNDGWEDLIVSSEGGNDNIFLRRGAGYIDAGEVFGLNRNNCSTSVRALDYDKDGNLDLLKSCDNQAGTQLWKNNFGAINQFLKVIAVGKGAGSSSIDATGTRIELYDRVGKNLLATRYYTGAEGKGSHANHIKHFGLNGLWGGANVQYRVKVYFPSGQTAEATVRPSDETNNTVTLLEP